MLFIKTLRIMTSTVFAGTILLASIFAYGERGIDKQEGKPKAKNVIVMIADGCGYNHVDAASLYEHGKTGSQIYEKFDIKLGMSTYCDGQSYNPEKAWKSFSYMAESGATDSAAAATTMSTGSKTYSGAIGLDSSGYKLKHAMDAAESYGKATGVVTSVQLSHATPAGFSAHNKTRDNYVEIANEMFYKSALEVIMGCGHPLYTNDNKKVFTRNTDEGEAPDGYNYEYIGGENTWKDLSDDWSLAGAHGIWKVIDKRSAFQDLMTGSTPERVIGIAQSADTLQASRSGSDIHKEPYGVALNSGVPTLEEMTKGAINVLDEDPDGFFLMIEGGAVDWASHEGHLPRMIEEQIDFSNSVEAVVDWIEKNSSWTETLLIVTADHETGYLTGPNSGQKEDGPVWTNLVNNGKGKISGAEFNSGDHTNSLVPFYAQGVGADLFRLKATEHDPVRGYYIDNTDMGRTLSDILVQKE